MPRLATANDIINRCAVECGLFKDANPVSSTDENFIQLTELLNSAGQEMVELHPWQTLRQVHSITTTAVDSGVYTLPDDFSYMIDQTGWDRTNTNPLGGPLSAQDWTYLEGRDLASSTIWASFRLAENNFELFPQPPMEGIDITFEYISRDWVAEGGNQTQRRDYITTGADVVLYEPILMIKMLKVKWLSAKGFDLTTAVPEFELMFNSRTGKDEGAAILTAGGNFRQFPYMDTYRNTGDTGYGV